MKDILGLGQVLPIDKLIDIVSKSVGRISKSYFDRKDIDTRAYEIKKLAEARAEEMKIISTAVKKNFQLTGGIEYKEEKLAITSPKETEQPILLDRKLEDRAKERIDFQEAKRQINIENITAIAADELKNEQSVTNEPVDEDWATRFFRITEDVSSEEMQALWGKILAGEVKRPKSYSLRTLELIRNLSKKEADIFMKVANFAIKSGHEYHLFKGNDDEKLSRDFNITYSDIALLKEIGLMQPGDFVEHQFRQQPNDSKRALIAGSVVIIINTKANTPTFGMQVDVFSNSGNELMQLIKSTPPFDYLKYVANSIKSPNVDIKYANILAFEGDNVRHTKPLMDF